MSSGEPELGPNQFECGHLCQDNPLMIYLTAITSVILLSYAAFLQWKRSRDRVFVIIRAMQVVFLVVRVPSVIVPATVPFVATFITARQVALFLSVFLWHKSVVDSSWKAAKVSLTSPAWIKYFTWIQMAIIVLVFPITYGLGAHPLGNPRCSAVQAINSAYRLFMGLSLAGSMVYCNFIIYRTVSQLRTQNKINGSNEGLQRRMNRALMKIRKVSAFIFLVALVVTYTFATGAIGTGEPFVECNATFGDVFGSISSSLAAYLILWSTDSSYGPNGSSSATKSISSSGDHAKSPKSKTYSEMQQEKTQLSSVQSRDSGFAYPSSNGGGFSSPVATPRNGGFASPFSPPSRPGSVSPPSRPHSVSPPSRPNSVSPQTSPRAADGFTAGPSRASTSGGFVRPPPSRPSSLAPSRASTAVPNTGSAPINGGSSWAPSNGPFGRATPPIHPPPMQPNEVV